MGSTLDLPQHFQLSYTNIILIEPSIYHTQVNFFAYLHSQSIVNIYLQNKNTFSIIIRLVVILMDLFAYAASAGPYMKRAF